MMKMSSGTFSALLLTPTHPPPDPEAPAPWVPERMSPPVPEGSPLLCVLPPPCPFVDWKPSSSELSAEHAAASDIVMPSAPTGSNHQAQEVRLLDFTGVIEPVHPPTVNAGSPVFTVESDAW